MKKLLLCFAFIVSAAFAAAQGVFLNAGQDYVFEFDTLPRAEGHAHSQVIAWFAPDLQWDALLEIFPNSLSDIPLLVTGKAVIDEYPSGIKGIAYSWIDFGPYARPPFFSDLQGVLRVTMPSGTAHLLGFEVSQTINGEFYSEYFAVPEPGVGALVTTGLGCLLSLKKFKRSRLVSD